MFSNNQDVTQGWDARQEFVKELVFRGHLVGRADDKDPKNWFETISDYFDWACVYYTEEEIDTFDKDLEEIDSLLYASKVEKDGKVIALSDYELRERRKQSYTNLRKLFKKMHRTVYDSGGYMPIRKKRDPNRAVAGYYE